jgi:hypothetical protein
MNDTPKASVLSEEVDNNITLVVQKNESLQQEKTAEIADLSRRNRNRSKGNAWFQFSYP